MKVNTKPILYILCGAAVFAMVSSTIILLTAVVGLDNRTAKLENFTRLQIQFDGNVEAWAKDVNNIIGLYNGTG